LGSAYDTLCTNGRSLHGFRAFFARFAENPFRKRNEETVDRSMLIAGANDNDADSLVVTGHDDTSVVNLSVGATNAQREMSKFGKCLTAFSIRRNVAALFSTKRVGDQLDCLNGMRVISMFWVIIGHTYFWSINNVSDFLLAYAHYAQSWTFQVMWSGTFSV